MEVGYICDMCVKLGIRFRKRIMRRPIFLTMDLLKSMTVDDLELSNLRWREAVATGGGLYALGND